MSRKNSKTVSKSIEETRQYHIRYLRAVNHPLRRKILRALKGGYSTIEDLHLSTGTGTNSLIWHLKVLEHGFCVEKEVKNKKLVYMLTQEGSVVDYMD